MSLSETQQAASIINRASDLLLIVPEKASIDAISSMIALYLRLQTPGQQNSNSPNHLIDQISPSHLPPALQFLAGSSQIKTKPTKQAEVILDIAGPVIIDNIRQEKLQGGTRLHVSLPPGNTITKDQLETSVRSLPYEAAIIIGASDLEELGDIFFQNTDFFYNTPIINIDHRAANEHFGTVNLVDITASSLAEVTHDLITNHNQNPVKPDVATALYAGVIAGTDSFQKPSTTPRSFQLAATLIEQKANREAVIQHLVKTKPLKTIKFLGTVYARLQYEEQSRLYWASLNAEDFLKQRTTPDDIPPVIQELTNNIAGFNAFFLLYENPTTPTTSHTYTVYLVLGKGLKQKRREIKQALAAHKTNGALTFSVPAPTLQEAEKITHQKIRQILP